MTWVSQLAFFFSYIQELINPRQWPQPVLLKMIEDGPLSVRVWNPKIYPQDKSHRMPVITPSYPSMCSTHNITQSTQTITTDEFGRAAEIADQIMLGNQQWSALFQKDDFFHKYKYYLQVIASSSSAEAQIKWAGLVENLEIAHPYMKGFDRSLVCTTEKQKDEVHHGIFPDENNPDQTDDSEPIEPTQIWTTIFYVGLGVAPKDPNSAANRRLDFTWPTNEFSKLVKSWDQYDEEKMGIVIKYIRR